MRGWQLALAAGIISLSQAVFAVFYMRPRALLKGGRNRFSSWRILFVISLAALFVSLMLLIVPEEVWWKP
jgi:hypothetical protein